MNNNNQINAVGYWSGMTAFSFACAFGIAQILQLIGVLVFPWDEILIYGFSLCIVIPLLLTMLALHCNTDEENQFWSHAALIFMMLYAVFVTANYVVQLATVIPMTIAGNDAEVTLLKQTPHSMFWNFDAIGYVFMGLATFAALPVLRIDKSPRVKYSFIAHSLVTPLIALVYFYPTYSKTLLFIASPWLITGPLFMFLLAMRFRAQSRESADKQLLSDKLYSRRTDHQLLVNKN